MKKKKKKEEEMLYYAHGQKQTFNRVRSLENY